MVVGAYRYADETGRTLYVKERLEPKRFRQFVPTPGGRQWTLNGTRRVLYRLPEVLEAVADGRLIFLCEGEKDTESVRSAGVVATTWTDGAWQPGAAPKWRPEYSEQLLRRLGGDCAGPRPGWPGYRLGCRWGAAFGRGRGAGGAAGVRQGRFRSFGGGAWG